jgi:hypothetical protein
VTLGSPARSSTAVPLASVPARDVYADLLERTRGFSREASVARAAWFAKLDVDKKDELLFEFEVLLKGLACFANPRNHPGPPRRVPVVAQDFREQLEIVRAALDLASTDVRALLGERDKAFVFHRYIETVLPDDSNEANRWRLGHHDGEQTPEESLLSLRQALTNLLEVTSALVRLERMPYRSFCALLGLAHREIAQSLYFNPLAELEFRAEFDQITSPEVLEAIQSVPGGSARRLIAVTFLALFRMLRYLAVIEAATREEDDARRMAGVVYPVLAVLRSDARALSGALRRSAGSALADGYERHIFRTPAQELEGRYEALLAEGHRLIDVKSTLGGIAANLRLEIRRVFERELPAPDTGPNGKALAAAARAACTTLRPALRNGILLLGKTLGERLDASGVFSDSDAQRALSERLRRDVWMFSQVVRAFAVKARAAESRPIQAEANSDAPPAEGYGENKRPSTGPWGNATGGSPLAFVREFLAYFRAMGVPLLRAADYPRVDAYLRAMAALEEEDLLDPERLGQATAECEQFYEFLLQLFEAIGQRDELRGVPFDRRAAAEALRLYLND